MHVCLLSLFPPHDAAALDTAMAAAQARGCDHIVLPNPFAQDAQGRLHDPAADDPGGQAQLRKWIQRAEQHGLRVLLDLRIDEIGGGSRLLQEHPHWFRARSSALPDPRAERAAPDIAVGRFASAEEGAGLAQWWSARLLDWVHSGVAGFRVLQPQRVPASLWRTLIDGVHAHAPQARLLAWTPGLGLDALRGLAGAGFDAAFSSLAWWDGRGDWFFDEDSALRALARCVVATVDAETASDTPLPLPRAQRQRLAAAFGGAWAIAAQDTPTEHGQPTSAQHESSESDASTPAASLPDATASLRLRPLLRDGALTAVAVEPLDAAPWLVLLNSDRDHLLPVPGPALLRLLGDSEGLLSDHGEPIQGEQGGTLEACEVRIYRSLPARPVLTAARARTPAEVAAGEARVCIEAVTPSVDDGRFPVKRTVGDRVCVEANAFCDGHDRIAVALLWRAADARTWSSTPMRALGNDRWRGEFPLQRLGRYEFRIEAWRDVYATTHADLEKKRAAGTLLSVDVQEALAQVEAARGRSRGAMATRLKAIATRIARTDDLAEKAQLLLEPDTAEAMARADAKPFRTEYPMTFRVEAERRAAHFASWYELFPRSQSGDLQRHGTFDDVIARLPHIQAMGFDVLYMPPIHPIGEKNRKGRNNAVTAEPGEPGSPYAIGSAEGGHTEVHPELGGLDGFRRLRAAAAAHGLELALDFAIQCAPDHPWLRDHPDWFTWRADGSIPYAENPPKKYQDIVNVDFYASGAVPALWNALRDAVLFWVNEGVTLFRVDNPHTKPFPFWEWLIAEVRGRHPQVVFLSEAFTRPKPMYRLAKVGFSQSYTYFTWRQHKAELQAYIEELNSGAPSECFRPHFFVNTPDINPLFLQHSGRSGHLIRAALATTLSGLWGMYQGFELCEATPLPGKEEYLDSEKYQLRVWPERAPGDIVEEITRLNLLRRQHPELQSHLGTRFYVAHNEQVLYFGKFLDEAHLARGRSLVLVAVSLDPHAAQNAQIEVPLWELGLPDHASVAVRDLWDGHDFAWYGKTQHIRLDPSRPFSLWRIRAGVPA
ncbi:maltotransferase domain-containing protein [Xanthomonas sontii]|uniref:maltotransferase domain-containing protein n=1 Tax=Xanthomonas sontii TaxID=2650745 RepID=UPI003F8274BC